MKSKVKAQRQKFHIETWRIAAAFLMIYDIMAVNLSYFLALFFRFDGVFSQIPEKYMEPYTYFIPIYTVICMCVFYFTRMYHTVWRYAGFNELARTAVGSAIASVLHIVLITLIFQRMPISYYLWGACLQFISLVAARFSYRYLRMEVEKRRNSRMADRVMIVGAGTAGQMLLKSVIKTNKFSDRVFCMIDDDSNKWGRYIDNVPIVGGRDSILQSVEKYKIEKIYIAIPSAPKSDIRDIINVCSETNCELKLLPDFYQYVNENISISSMQDVSPEDLLGREPIKTDMKEVYDLIRGKTILVTGGGGSIGSELCRQIAAHEPKLLLIFDIYENNAYEIQQELKMKYPQLNFETLIGSVRDSRRLNHVFSHYKPDIVYHAAAHKHVPLMEVSPCEAIKNNVIGTYKTAYAAMVNNCERFVLISTDKAVNPTNIMGASKRLCEMVIQFFDRKIKEGTYDEIHTLFTHSEDNNSYRPEGFTGKARTEYVAVRFGNVLGSNGSVVPLFKQQIKNGGPVKVTHPDIIRYFMTIPEAVSLVLLAGAYAGGGEIFVLDMGSPVNIDTLARNLIRLSGFTPDVDIRIEYTGLRPGEKLYEEKLMQEEGLKTTPNKLIHIGNPVPFDTDVFQNNLAELMFSAYENTDHIADMVEKMVPTYKKNLKVD